MPTTSASPSPQTGPRPKQTLPPPLPELHGRIYYAIYDNNPERQTFDIYAVRLDSGERQMIVSQASQPALSPEGTRLAYRSWKAGRQGVGVLDLETQSVSIWVDRPGVTRPDWSPDGQRLAFAAQQGPGQSWTIFEATDAGVEPVQGRSDGVQRQMPVWLADGRLAYQGCPANRCGLYASGGDGSGPEQQITDGPDTAPAPSPHGNAMAFMSERNGNWDIYLVDCREPAAVPVRLTDDPAREGLPTWSPDGEWLAFVSDRSGAWAVWIMQPDGSEQRRLFSLGGPLEGRIASISTHDQPDWTWETLAWGP
jgi:Tol biopolymer transport system component